MKHKEIINKYKDVIPYLFFGICTTLVNVIVYWMCAHIFKCNTMASTTIAWFLAVLFAYLTNRKWVFQSEAKNNKDIIKECLAFFGCRLTTGFIDWGCMFLFVQILAWNDIIIKVSANILVIILNYIASKLLIFNKETPADIG